MCAIFPSVWVRKLTGQTRVPYNRGLRVQSSPHPYLKGDYATDLLPPAAERRTCRNQSDLRCRDWRIASPSCFASGGVKRTATITPFAFCVPIFGLPTRFFIINVYKYVASNVIPYYGYCNIKIDVARRAS
jgi:hypothetical protein